MSKLFTETSSSMAEFKGQIVDILEDVLTEHEAKIRNEDKDLAVKDGRDPDELAVIYGDDYDVIAELVCDIVLQEDLEEHPAVDEAYKNRIVETVLESYKEIADKAEFTGEKLTEDDYSGLAGKIKETFLNWNLFE